MAAEIQPAPALVVLHSLRVVGFIDLVPLVARTGLPPDDVTPVLNDLVERALARRRDGRVAGWALTGAGQEEHGRRLAEASAALPRSAVETGYERFVDCNDELKQLCTDWQLGGDRGTTAPALAAFAGRAEPVADTLGRLVPWMARYGERLQSAARRFAAGDDHALTRPLSGSYHDVWMELHQDLLLTLGRERSAADGH